MSREHTLSSFADWVQVRQGSTRSVHIETDLHRQTISDAYLLTVQARRSLLRLLTQSQVETPQRAWTLTGPYGSGKSYFGLFLMNLLCQHAPAHAQAQQILAEFDQPLVELSVNLGRTHESKGLLPIPITGYRSSIQECIRQGICRVAESLKEAASVRQILDNLAAWDATTPSRQLVSLLQDFLAAVTAPDLGYAGILIILDEMGKPLEYASSNPEQSDLFLLQEIAEMANRSGDKPLLFVGILHQAFERYAGYTDGLTQKEWAKIQGRFEDVAFQEPPAQQMWLLANALIYTDGAELPHTWSNRYIEEAIEYGWTPPLLKEEEFRHLCRQALPFHPTALVAIPYLFQRLAQNERSMFAYLASSEPKGFQAYLLESETIRQVRLPDLFDYLAANYQGRLYATLRARPLTEALERIEGLVNPTPLAVSLLKTVGLLNWLAEIGPFQASVTNLIFALHGGEWDDAEIQAGIEKLLNRSAIVFRRFNQTYAIWQGSDVDVEERMEEARQRLGNFSTAQAVQQYLPPRPAVARRHSYQTGVTRFFEIRYVDKITQAHVSLEVNGGASGLLLLCLSESAQEADEFTIWAKGTEFQQRGDLLFGVFSRIPRLSELLREMRSLHWVQEHTPELRDDPVARRELRTRLNDLETLIRNELEQTVQLQRTAGADRLRWYHRGQEVAQSARRGLSHLLSEVCDDLYGQSPMIRNEILNRRQLSSQGAAARRNLIEAILERAGQPTLGIEGYPPERSMYESLLRKGGLHRQNDAGEWTLRAPQQTADPLALHGIWQAIGAYIFASPPQPRGLQALYDRLQAPPYGLTQGVIPVLLAIFLQVHQHETTLYNEGSLLPEPGIADWEVLLRRPELFSVAGCRITGPRQQVVARLARGLQTEAAAMPVVRDLIRRLKSLPEHTWRTQRLSPTTLNARQAIDRARSPENLLFDELPRIFGIDPFNEVEMAAEGQIERFFQALNQTLQELNDAMPRLLSEARDRLLEACHLPPSDEGWQQFLALAVELADKVHRPPLAPLLKRAGESPDPAAALESTLAYVANRPPRSWTDHDRLRFEQQAVSLGTLFVRERNGYYTEAGMTSVQRSRSRNLTEKVRRYLHELQEEDPIVLQSALQALLQEYRQLDEEL